MRSTRRDLLRTISSVFARLLAAATLCFAGCGEGGAQEHAGRERATVTKVTDGDTIRLSGLGRVRLIGVDTPEVFGGVECYGREASAFTKRTLPPGTRVWYRLGVEERDRYGRALAYVWLGDGRMLNALLAEEGYATPLTVPPNMEFAERFVAAARGARRAAKGLWSPGTCPDSAQNAG